MKKIRKRLTYANVMSSIAVFLVLGGATAFAASQLGKNTVGTKQLKKSAVNSAKVKDGSLQATDFKAGQLPAGPQGKDGKTGSQGPQGPQGLQGKEGQRGPSNGLSIRGEAVIGWSGADQTLVTLTLTPGNWLITTKTTANNNGLAQAEYRCELRVAGTVIDRNHGGVIGVPLAADGGVDRQTTALTNGVTVSSGSAAALVCNSIGATQGNFIEPTMTAVQVATLNGA